jgi:hypothetical protein
MRTVVTLLDYGLVGEFMGYNEVWKDVVGWEGFYKVSNNGKILSLAKNVRMKTHINGRGYECFLFTKNGKRINVRVHQVVAKAFLPNQNSYPEVNHVDGNKKNNLVENLEWCTRDYNLRHAVNNNLFKGRNSGEINGQSKLKKSQVRYIKKALREKPHYGIQAELAKKFNVSPATIFCIKCGKAWDHIM